MAAHHSEHLRYSFAQLKNDVALHTFPPLHNFSHQYDWELGDVKTVSAYNYIIWVTIERKLQYAIGQKANSL